MKLALLCLITILLSSLAEGQKGASGKTGNDLLPACTAALDEVDGRSISADQMLAGRACGYYVAGFLDGWGFGQVAAQGTKETAICPPEGFTSVQAIRIFTKWMREHPEKLNEGAGPLLFFALRDAFGCKSS